MNPADEFWLRRNGMGAGPAIENLPGDLSSLTAATGFTDDEDNVFFAEFSADPLDTNTVPLASDVKPNAITFVVNGYTIEDEAGAGNVILVDDDGLAIDVITGQAVISVAIESEATTTGQITVNGTAFNPIPVGTLVLSGDNSGALGLLSVAGGAVEIAGNYGGALTLDGGDVDAQSGEISGATTVTDGVLTLSGSTFANGAVVDVETGTTELIVAADTEVSVTTDSDVTVNGGVTLDGTIAATANGDVTINGIVTDAVTNDGGLITLDGAEVRGGVDNNTGTVTVSGDSTGSTVTDPTAVIIANSDILNVSADWDGSITQDAGTTTLTGDVSGSITLTGGTLDADGGVVTGAVTVGDLTDPPAAEIVASGTQFDGGLGATSGGTITIDGDTSANVVNDGGTVEINPLVTLTGTLSNLSGETTNNGTVQGNVDLAGDATDVVFNNGQINGTVTLSGGTFEDAAGGAAGVSDTVTNNGGTINHRGGTFGNSIVNNSGALNLLASNNTTITNAGGTVDISSGVIVSGTFASTDGTTNNAGTINNALVLSGADTNIINNNEFGLLVGDLTIGGDAIVNNNTGADIDGAVAVTGGTLNADGGTFQEQILNNGGRVNVSANTIADLRNESGNSFIGDAANVNTSLSLQGQVTVVSGSVTNSGTIDGGANVSSGSLLGSGDITGLLNVTGGSVDLNGGEIGSGGSEATISGGDHEFADVTFANGLRTSGGTTTMDGPISGILTVEGGNVTLNDNQTLTGSAAVNGGTMTANGLINGDATLTTGTLNLAAGVQNGVATASGGILSISGGTYDNQVQNTGATATVSGGTFTLGYLNQGTGVTTTVTSPTTGSFTNDGGILNINGRLVGGVVHDGGATTQTALVEQDVMILSGGYNLQSEVSGETTLVTGALRANGGTFGSGLVAEGGAVFFSGVSNTGNVINNGSTIEILEDARLDGNVTNNDNQFINRGTLDGTLTMDGGITTNHSGARILGAAVLQTGTLNASGGSFEGGLTLQGGTFNLNGDTTGNITNEGLDVTVSASQTLTGDFQNTSGTLTHNGDVDGRVIVSGGQVNVGADATVTEDLRVNGGNVDVAGGTFEGGIVNNGGTVQIAGDVQGSVTALANEITTDASANITGNATVQSGGRLTHGGVIQGRTAIDGGTLANSGTLDGNVVISGGTLNNRAAGEVTGDITVNGGRLVSRGGDVGRQITNNGGTVVIRQDTTVQGSNSEPFGVDNADGVVEIEASATLSSDLLNSDEVNLEGVLDGDLSSGGVVNAGGDVNGAVTNTGTFNVTAGNTSSALTIDNATTARVRGAFDNTGEVVVSDGNLRVRRLLNRGDASRVSISGGNALVSDGNIDFRAGTLRINNGSIEGNMDFGADATVNLTNAEMEGQINTATLMRNSGQSSLAAGPRGDGGLTFEGNGGLLIQADGAFDVEGDINTLDATDINLEARATLTAGGLVNEGVLSLGRRSTLTSRGLIENNGTLLFSNLATINGRLRNTSEIRGSGTLSFADGLTGGGTVNLQQNSDPTDRVEIGGNLGNQQFNLDIDLSGTEGQSDQIQMTGDAIITGTVQLNFNLVGSGGEQDENVVVIDAASGQNPNDYEIIVTGLSGVENDSISIVEYGATINNRGDVVVFDGLSAGVGSLAGNIVLAQSLIGSVINRPSSPFVSGLAFEDENPCGIGTWARTIGGQADGSGQVEQGNGVAFEGNISADYYGVQIGGDYACFNGFYNGWDLAFGGIVGANFGQSSQPVFALNPSADNGLSDVLLSTTDVDFTQLYGGVYVAAVRDELALDLQYRVEETEFTATNVGVDGGSALGLTDEKFNSNAQTLSGALSYAFPLPDYNITVVPTAGFAYTRIETDPITFQGLGVLEITDFDSRTAFVGATISRTRFGSDGVSALTQFGTATVYNDFAESPVSIFTTFDDSGNLSNETFTTTTENLGLYGEISAGLNYTRILQPGEFGAAKQFNASLRSDIRVSDQLESWGLTAQARIQF